ncbi:MAG: peptide deformylase [Clostridia bacterium]|nr:peptide deformylase [Clostridia bacterium]
MIRELMHDPLFLAKPSQPATKEDAHIAKDLVDTITAHSEECVGMAANMIGESKRIICFLSDKGYQVMFNPEIIKQEGAYDTQEGCLSLLGGPRLAKRYKKIKVEYQTQDGKKRLQTFEGWTAQIIQHEIDHCNGILI